MSLFGSDDTEGSERPQAHAYETHTVSSDTTQLAAASNEREAIVVRPHKENGGIESMHEVLTSLHGVETQRSGVLRRSTENVSPAHAFEIAYTKDDRGDRTLSLQYVDGTDGPDSVLRRQLQNEYSDSLIESQPATFLPLSTGQHVAGATLALRRYTLMPIRSDELDDWGSDPTGSIMQEMVGLGDGEASGDADVITQIMFKPATRDWLQGVSNGMGVGETEIDGTPSVADLTYELRQPSYEIHRPVPWERETIEHQPSKKDKDVATMLEEQDGKAWRVFIRVFAAADDPEVAQRRASSVADMYGNYYEFRGEQTFVPQPLSAVELPDALEAGARREWADCGMVKTQREVAGLVNVPEAEDVATNKLRWSLAKPGDGVPPGTARFDAQKYGVESGTDAEQIAMLDNCEPGDPFWFGRGSKHGVEAGVYADYLDAHMFIAGATRYGKTVFQQHVGSQFLERGHGGVIIDPKGQDADDFIREWPDHRDPDDLIVMDLEDDDHIPRFNFLEIPADVDPDSRECASMIEAIADDLTAMVAQSGGSDNYLGALMKRVTKTVARGLLRSGRSVHLLDLACACSSVDALSEFGRWMDDERIEFIRETAQRLAEKEDSDLEPLAGRMDEWIHNDAVRDLISARDPSFSVHDLVKEGKVLVVRFPRGAGDTERRLLTTALIRRTYCSKRLVDDGEPFYLVCDEFDKIVTKESTVHQILSEAGGFQYRCVLSCQAPASQLPDRVGEAIENQCETFLTFNPGGGKNAGFVAQQHTVDKDALLDMPRYKLYMRTHDRNHEMTHSYLVDAFPPIDEVRDGDGMSDDELAQLKAHSAEQYGAPIESAAEQQAASHFTAGDAIEESTDDSPTIDLDDDRRALVYKAVYDELLRTNWENRTNRTKRENQNNQKNRNNWENKLSFADLREHIRDVLDEPDASEGALQDCKDRLVDGGHLVETTDDDGTVRYSVSGEGIAEIYRQGASPTAGKERHRRLVRRMYPLLVGRAGLDIDIGIQGGSKSMPDLLAHPRRDLPNNPIALQSSLDEFEEENPLGFVLSRGAPTAIEIEKSTADSPEKTVSNLRGALDDDRRCLFVVADGDSDKPTDHYAQKVWGSITDRCGDVSKKRWMVLILPSDESADPLLFKPGETPPLSNFED